MSNFPILIHIGFPKTASTWLQQKIFTDSKLGFANINYNSGIGMGFQRKIILQDDFSFNHEQIREDYSELIEKSYTSELVSVLSREDLSMNPWGYAIYQTKIADRIREVFPSAKISFFIREQSSLFFSLYNELVKSNKYNLSLEDYLDNSLNTTFARMNISYSNPSTKASQEKLIPSYLFYDQLVKCYQDRFGVENVLVLPFEMFVKNRKEILKTFIKFTTAKVQVEDVDQYLNELLSGEYANLSLQPGVLNLKYKLNKVLYADLSYFKSQKLKTMLIDKIANIAQSIISEEKHKQEKERMMNLIRKSLGDMYKQSNQKTSDLININLADFGYIS